MQRGLIAGIKQLFIPSSLGGGDPANDGQVLTFDSTVVGGVKPGAGGAAVQTTKGDLAGYSTTPARIPVGADTTVLTADSTQALGVKWATPTAAAAVPTTVTSRSVQVGGNITLASTGSVSAEIAAATGGPGTGGLDITIAAATSDVLLVSGVVLFDALNTNQFVAVDLATWVSGAAVNWLFQSAGALVGTNDGLIRRSANSGTGADYGPLTFSIPYVVQAGDITGGNVVFRPFYGSSAAAGTLGRSAGSSPLIFGVSNLKH